MVRDYRQLPQAKRADEAKDLVVREISLGKTVEEASKTAGRSIKTYENWRTNDPDFAKRVNEARTNRNFVKRGEIAPDNQKMDFESWRLKFLHRETYPHQRMWIDILEGRPPTDLHESMTYLPARPNRILLNTPPFHAKSTIITQEYVVYRIAMDPTVRVCIVSKTQQKAKKFLYSIKKMLTSATYAPLQAAYAPADGWKHPDYPWTATWIYVDNPQGTEKDPTVEVLGIRGDIYGGRYDLIILDDCVTKENVTEWEKQLDWINQEVSSRLYHGKLCIVGTRVASTDLYSELRNPDNFTSGVSAWTYLSQPAVLEFDEDPKKWVTLWPRSTTPLDAEDPGEADADGTYAAWDGPALREVRDAIRLSTWSLVYQQQQVADDAVFNPQCVRASMNRIRKPGTLRAGAFGHPREGMEGQYIIASMDPAMTGETFTLVYSVDKRDNVRRVLNCWVKASPTPEYIRNIIYQVTDEYSVNEWVIEQNAFQLFLIHDPQVRDFLNTRGVKLQPHYTSRNKQDPDFGVASVAPLFGSLKVRADGRRTGLDHNGDNLIELPDNNNEGIKALIDQLITWIPGKLGKQLKQDGPMALWFAELRARAILGDGRKKRLHFVENPYLSRGDRARQVVVPVESYRMALYQ
jgi:hypothetical protein